MLQVRTHGASPVAAIYPGVTAALLLLVADDQLAQPRTAAAQVAQAEIGMLFVSNVVKAGSNSCSSIAAMAQVRGIRGRGHDNTVLQMDTNHQGSVARGRRYEPQRHRQGRGGGYSILGGRPALRTRQATSTKVH